jgi:hypothetical protein
VGELRSDAGEKHVMHTKIVRRQLGFATFCRETRVPDRTARTGFYELPWSWRGALFQLDAPDAPPAIGGLLLAGCGQGCATCTPFPGSFTVPAELDRGRA